MTEEVLMVSMQEGWRAACSALALAGSHEVFMPPQDAISSSKSKGKVWVRQQREWKRDFIINQTLCSGSGCITCFSLNSVTFPGLKGQ